MQFVPASRPAPRTVRVLFATDAAYAALPAPLHAEAERRLGRGPVATLPTLGLLTAPLIAVAQPPDWQQPVSCRRRGGAIGRALAAEQLETCQAAVPASPGAEPFLQGLAQGAYRYENYKPKPTPRLSRVAVAGLPAALLARNSRLATVTALCRDWVNCPAEDMGPTHFVAAARAACRGTGLRLRLLDETACRKLGMGCLLGVGRAAGKDRRPRLLVVEWPGRRTGRKSGFLALCGKGVCFDTGGVQVKPHDGMQLMRKDMGGAATVLAAMLALADERAAAPVRAYLPLVENAIGGDAFRPGDVLRAMDGTTVEVGHTDAEGRLILADAMSLARREGATGIVTVATLTGAALYALGRIHVPVMGSGGELTEQLVTAAAAAGEKAWRLPLDEDHHRLVKASKLAVLTNSAGPDAGCITAGAFLAHFAGELPFAHCDISPASWFTADHDLGPAGASGVFVDTLRRLVDPG